MNRDRPGPQRPYSGGQLERHASGGRLSRADWDTSSKNRGWGVLRSILPTEIHSVLDLGCGDGRLAALVLESARKTEYVLAVDSSPLMLDHARSRFAGMEQVEVRPWDLNRSIATFGSFDVIISGFTIHHLPDERKYSLYREAALQPLTDGLFANLEVVASATPELHAESCNLSTANATIPKTESRTQGSSCRGCDKSE